MNTSDLQRQHWAEMVKYFVDMYDSKISLEQYWTRMFPNEQFSTTMKCKLHGEEHGESFSYSKNLGIWSCFGRCHTGGKTVAYHKRYMRLNSPKFSTIDTLNTLRVLFPELGLPDVTIVLRSPKVTSINVKHLPIKNLQNRLEDIKKTDKTQYNKDCIDTKLSFNARVFKNFVHGYIMFSEKEQGVEFSNNSVDTNTINDLNNVDNNIGGDI